MQSAELGQTELTHIDGLVISRELRNGRLYFAVSSGERVHACFDATGEMGPMALYPGCPVRCIGQFSERVAGYFEVRRIEHCVEHVATQALRMRNDSLVRALTETAGY